MENFFDSINLDEIQTTPTTKKKSDTINIKKNTEDVLDIKLNKESSVLAAEFNAYQSSLKENIKPTDLSNEKADKNILLENEVDFVMEAPKKMVKIEPVKTVPTMKSEKNIKLTEAKAATTTKTQPEINNIVNIGKGCSLSGSMTSENDFMIAGRINGSLTAKGVTILSDGVTGDIQASGDIISEGNIVGDLIAKNIILKTGSKTKGNISECHEVTIQNDAKFIGNINCESIIIYGAIKGDIKATNDVYLKKGCIITGNIKATSIHISDEVAAENVVLLKNQNIDSNSLFDF